MFIIIHYPVHYVENIRETNNTNINKNNIICGIIVILLLCSILQESIPLWAAAVGQRTEGLIDCLWAFVDGTMRLVCRPERGQVMLYSGKEKVTFGKNNK